MSPKQYLKSSTVFTIVMTSLEILAIISLKYIFILLDLPVFYVPLIFLFFFELAILAYSSVVVM